MKPSTQPALSAPCGPIRLTLIVTTLVAVAAVAGCAGPPQTAATMTSAPFGARLQEVVEAHGTQTYRCTASADGRAFAWRFLEAAFDDPSGQRVGRHHLDAESPATPGEAVLRGTVVRSAPSPRAGAVAWQLVQIEPGPNSRSGGAVSVQRVNTEGGAAPGGGCSAQTVGALARVPYRADYRLLVSR